MGKKIEAFLNIYKEIHILHESPKSKVILVFNTIDEHIYIKKYLQKNDTYKKIKDIRHRLLPQIYYLYEDNNNLVVIEEYINGQTLRDLVNNKKEFSDIEIQDIISQLCKGLSVLHKQYIIHRDITPTNIILTNDNIVKLIDFDIVRQFKVGKENDTVYLGTKSYAAPEQYGYTQTDKRTDIYSIGAIIDFLNPKSQMLKNIAKRAKNIDPQNRYQSVDEIIDELNGTYNCLKKVNKSVINELEMMLKQNLKMFKLPIPVQKRDFPFFSEEYRLKNPIEMVTPVPYESYNEAEQKAIEELDRLMYEPILEHIKLILNEYKINYLSTYYNYERNEKNYYYRINKDIEGLIADILDYFKINLPDYITSFEYIPEYVNLIDRDDEKYFHLWQLRHFEDTNNVQEVELIFQNRTCSKEAQDFVVYASGEYKVDLKITDLKVKIPHKRWFFNSYYEKEKTFYSFDIDEICVKFIDELVYSADVVVNDNTNLQEDIESVLMKYYLPGFENAIADKINEILDFVKSRNLA